METARFWNGQSPLELYARSALEQAITAAHYREHGLAFRI